jgi:hypothetical protein
MNILELARSIGCPVDFIAFEHGIVLRPQGDNWVVHSRSRAGPVEVLPLDVAQVCLPVLVRCRPRDASLTIFDVMVRPDGGFVPLVPVFGITPSLIYDATAVQYLSGALSYHIAAIVGIYESVCDSFKDFELIPGRKVGKHAIFGDQPEPYYEFDALLGVIRRSYDACRYLLWKCFGPPKGGIPRSFEKVLPFCERLDQETRKELDDSWRIWGVTVTEYRDCVHHYVPLDFGMASIAMEELFPGVWSALARIPDNPKARSKSQFTFKKGVDALSFGWRAASEARRVLRIVADAVQRSHNDG